VAAKTPQPAGDAAKTALTHVENTLDPIIFPDSRVLLLGGGSALSMLRRLPSSVNVFKVKNGFRC